MKLLTKEILKKLPKLGVTSELKSEDINVVVKFFAPWGSWSWYAVEFDCDDLFFGYVRGDFPELGMFSLSELQSVTGPFGLKIERDRYFGNHTLQDVMDKIL